MKPIRLFSILFVVFCISIANAQKPNTKKANKTPTIEVINTLPSVCDGVVLNSIVVSAPNPEYPSEAETAAVVGSVAVRVKIDEKGNVIKAEVCSGHALLRESATNSAKQTKFAPTILSGKSVKVSGILIYYFPSESLHSGGIYELPCKSQVGNGGVLNSFAIKLVKPEYPKELKGTKISGAVTTLITIDEEGKVISASAFSRYEEFKKQALEAVKQSTFKRFVRCGKPVKVTGNILYNFIPPEE